MPFDETSKNEDNGREEGAPDGYKKAIQLSPLVKLQGLTLSLKHRESAAAIQQLFEESFLNGVDYAVAEINARHGTQYTLE